MAFASLKLDTMKEGKTNVSFVDSEDLGYDHAKKDEHFFISPSATRGDLVVEDQSSDSDVVEQPTGCWNTWQQYPKHVFLIVGNEFCERFSYYGMRTVLTLYIVNILGFSDDNSVAMYHGFIVLCYTTPLLGSILADGYIGKFHTILWISLLYASGNIVLAVSAMFDKNSATHPALDFLGLIIIGFGTGGIKPCVSAFGGDQFKKGQERILETFFSVFYFSINAGATISGFVTPYMRVMPCMGRDTCYPLAFGVPAILMCTSVLFFIIGSRWYTRYPPKENVMLEVVKTMKSALSNKRFFQVNRQHWLDHHLDNHSCTGDMKCEGLARKLGRKPGDPSACHQRQFVDDIKAFLRVSIMYLPVPVFWALYDLQGSRWVLQGVAMDGKLWGNAVLLPDQMPTVNAVLIMLFIPLFQGVVYPTVKKLGINFTPLRKMTVGGLLTSASFVIAMFVQIAVNKTLAGPPAANEVHLTFINTYPCNVSVSPIGNNISGAQSSYPVIPTKKSYEIKGLKISDGTYSWKVNGSCIQNQATIVPTAVQAGKAWYTILNQYQSAGTFVASQVKSTTGEGQFKISVNFWVKGTNYTNQQYLFCSPYKNDFVHPCVPKEEDNIGPIKLNSFGTSWNGQSGRLSSTYIELKPKYWQLYKVLNGSTAWKDRRTKPKDVAKFLQTTNISFSTRDQGAVYTLTIWGDNEMHMNVSNQNLVTIVPPNSVSILLQIPQYVVVTAAEILFSITGLEFSYSQAPQSMKSVIQAVWLLTVAGGDLIDLIIAEARIFENLAYELLLYAILMAVVIVIFALMAQFWYKYNYYIRDDNEEDDAETKT